MMNHVPSARKVRLVWLQVASELVPIHVRAQEHNESCDCTRSCIYTRECKCANILFSLILSLSVVSREAAATADVLCLPCSFTHLQVTQMERHMNVLVGYMLLWVLFASVMLGAGDQIYHGLNHGLWYLRFNGEWPEFGQVGAVTPAEF